jgi:succinoglycan biosynthesis transport protein ExoP
MDRRQHIQKSEQDVDLRSGIGAVRQSIWSILAFAVISAVLAAVVAFYMTPIYQASTTLLIESRQANVIPIEEIYGIEAGGVSTFYKTQSHILQSRPLAESVITNLGLINYPEYSADKSGLQSKVREWLVSFLSLNEKDEDPLLAYEQAVVKYLDNLQVTLLPQTNLVRIDFQSEDRVLAAEAANAHAIAYIQSVMDARGLVADTAAEGMVQGMAELRENLTKAQVELQSFREQEGLIDLEGIKSLPSREINELSTRLVEVRRELSQARIAYVQVYKGGAVPVANLRGIPAILEDKNVQDAQVVEAEAQQQVAELAKRYGPAHAKMIAAQSELNGARANLRNQRRNVAESIKVRFEAVQAEEIALNRSLNRAKGNYQEIGRKESELLALQREVDTNRNLYDLFYKRIGETAATGDLASVPARIVEPAAVPRNPAKPDKTLITVAVFIMALLLGFSFAALASAFNNRIRSVRDVEEKLAVPVLGELPLLKSKALKGGNLGQVFLTSDEPIFNEAIRTVRTAISLDSVDNPNRVILVTSALPDEGKSTVALNLACAFAKMEKVLVIDADMRRPSVGKEFDLPRLRTGLAELLAGKAKFSECVVHRKEEKLDVLTSGLVPENPLECLSDHKFKQLLQALRVRYDRIIIDSPPMLPVSDGAVLSTYADSVVFVVKSDATTVRQAKDGMGKLRRANAVVAGVIINQIDLDKFGYSHYGGYYDAYLPQPA